MLLAGKTELLDEKFALVQAFYSLSDFIRDSSGYDDTATSAVFAAWKRF